MNQLNYEILKANENRKTYEIVLLIILIPLMNDMKPNN